MSYSFKAKVWIYQGGQGSWHFIGVPKELSEKIAAGQKAKVRRGWGSVRVRVLIGKTAWETSIFPDKKSRCYLLPLKAIVRKKEGIFEHDIVEVSLTII